MHDGKGVHVATSGHLPAAQNKENDYLMDRAAQKGGATFCGIAGIAQQDASLQESMGPIADRTKERLVSSDTGIVMARQKLRKAVEALAKRGWRPPASTRAPSRPLGRGRAAAAESFIDSARHALNVRPASPTSSV